MIWLLRCNGESTGAGGLIDGGNVMLFLGMINGSNMMLLLAGAAGLINGSDTMLFLGMIDGSNTALLPLAGRWWEGTLVTCLV